MSFGCRRPSRFESWQWRTLSGATRGVSPTRRATVTSFVEESTDTTSHMALRLSHKACHER
jgi:hypothetical protein